MPIFESSAEDVLGLWAAVPQSGTVSFGTGSPSLPAEEEVYSVHLPADPQAARQVFASSEATFRSVDQALNLVPARLGDLVERQQTAQPAAGVSFSARVAEQESGLDGELLGMLEDADHSVTGEVSFGLGDLTSQAWQAAKEQFNTLMKQIDRDVLHFAWVETTQSNQLFARTTVDWTGDMQTLYDDEISLEQSYLHEQTLRTVTRTRHLRLRLFVTVATGSIKVASLMAAPGGAALALPAVYQYVIKIVAQARELQSIQTPQGA
ncbi:MAG TPA: hypothetical protein VGK00_05325 [Anaerolineales bacterium]